MKYIGFYSLSTSWTRTEAMASSKIERQTIIVWRCTSFCIIGGAATNCLSCANSSSHFWLYSNLFLFLSSRMIGPIFSVNFGMNLDTAVNLPTSFCISLTFFALLTPQWLDIYRGLLLSPCV